MKLSLWRLVISLRDDIGRILERTLMPNAPVSERTMLTYLDPSSLAQLRGELRNRLDSLKDALSKELTESETYLVMFPLVLLCDEMVMSRVPKKQQTEWHLLQHELFQLNYGGDVFYDFVDERLAKPDTPVMVFEVLFFCLSAGFVGKFGQDGGKVQRYKALLTQRIPGALAVGRKSRRRREREGEPALARVAEARALPAPAPVPSSPATQGTAWYYAIAVGRCCWQPVAWCCLPTCKPTRGGLYNMAANFSELLDADRLRPLWGSGRPQTASAVESEKAPPGPDGSVAAAASDDAPPEPMPRESPTQILSQVERGVKELLGPQAVLLQLYLQPLRRALCQREGLPCAPHPLQYALPTDSLPQLIYKLEDAFRALLRAQQRR